MFHLVVKVVNSVYLYIAALEKTVMSSSSSVQFSYQCRQIN